MKTQRRKERREEHSFAACERVGLSQCRGLTLGFNTGEDRLGLRLRLALQRHLEELTTDCTDSTDQAMADSGPSVKSAKSVVETSKEVSL